MTMACTSESVQLVIAVLIALFLIFFCVAGFLWLSTKVYEAIAARMITGLCRHHDLDGQSHDSTDDLKE